MVVISLYVLYHSSVSWFLFSLNIYGSLVFYSCLFEISSFFQNHAQMRAAKRDLLIFAAGCGTPVPPEFLIMWNTDLLFLSQCRFSLFLTWDTLPTLLLGREWLPPKSSDGSCLIVQSDICLIVAFAWVLTHRAWCCSAFTVPLPESSFLYFWSRLSLAIFL